MESTEAIKLRIYKSYEYYNNIIKSGFKNGQVNPDNFLIDRSQIAISNDTNSSILNPLVEAITSIFTPMLFTPIRTHSQSCITNNCPGQFCTFWMLNIEIECENCNLINSVCMKQCEACYQPLNQHIK